MTQAVDRAAGDAPGSPVVFHDHDVAAKGVRERRFDVRRGDRIVPAMVWTPDPAPERCPLVLIGHGAAQTKSEQYVTALARILARHHGIASVAIDGPVHGDRRAEPADGAVMMLEFGQLWHQDAAVVDEMVADWRATLDAAQEFEEIGSDGAVGYWGLSMGTILGLPLVVREPRISAAVLGLMGVAGPRKEQLKADAAALSVPVLFVVQWDDTLFPRDRALALFDLLGTRDKRLHANPGAHGAVPAEEFLASARFLADRLIHGSSTPG